MATNNKRAVGARVEIGLFYFDSQSQIPMTCFLAFPLSPCLVLLPSSSRTVQYRPTLASGTKLTALQVCLDCSDRGVSQSVTTLQLFCNWEICLGVVEGSRRGLPTTVFGGCGGRRMHGHGERFDTNHSRTAVAY